MARKTSKELKAELQELKAKQTALKNHIIKRAKDYVKKYPDVPVGQFFLKDYGTFENYSVSDALLVIESVEKYNASLHPFQQSIIDWAMNNPKTIVVVPAAPEGTQAIISDGKMYTRTSADICNCDARDMPTYKEDGKTWCPQCGYEVR